MYVGEPSSRPVEDLALYRLQNAPAHANNQGRWEDLADLLLDPTFLEDKLRAQGVSALLADFAFVGTSDFPSRDALLTIRSALRLSATVLDHDVSQFVSQLSARLLLSHENSEISSFCADMQENRVAWLRAQTSSLVPVYSMLSQIFPKRLSLPSALAFTPAGDLLGSDGGVVRSWSTETGEELFALTGTGSAITALALDEKRTILVCAAEDGEVSAWDLNRRALLWHTKSNIQNPMEIHVSSSNDRVLVLGETGETRVVTLNLQTGVESSSLSLDFLRSIAITPDGIGCLGGSLDGRVDLWEVDTGREVRPFVHHGTVEGPRLTESEYAMQSLLKTGLWVEAEGQDVQSAAAMAEKDNPEIARQLRKVQAEPDPSRHAINAVCFDTYGQWVCTASEDHSIGIWSWPSGEQLRALAGHTEGVSKVLPVGASALLASASKDGTVRVWNRETGTEVYTLHGKGRPLDGLAVSLDGRWIAAANAEGDIEIYDLHARSPLPPLAHAGGVWTVSAIPELTRIFSIGQGSIQMRDAPDATLIRSIRTGIQGVLSCTSDGRRILVVHEELERGNKHSPIASAELQIWDLADLVLIQRVQSQPPAHWNQDWSAGWKFTRAAADDAGNYMISVMRGETQIPFALHQAAVLTMWDLKRGEPIATLSEKAGDAAVAMTPDGSRALALSGGLCTIYSPADGKEVEQFELKSRGPVAMARDSSSCVIAGEEELYWIQLKPTAKVLHAEKSSVESRVLGLAFNYDATLIASVHEDGTLQLWQAYSRPVARFCAEAALISCSFVAPNVVCAGDAIGRLHVVALEGYELSEKTVTAGPKLDSPWNRFDLARRLDRDGSSIQAVPIWRDLASDNMGGLAPLAEIACATLQELGYSKELAAVLSRNVISNDRKVAERLAAIERLRDIQDAEVLGHALTRVTDASFEPSGENGLKVVLTACRALVKMSRLDVLKRVMQLEETPALVRAAAADVLYVRMHDLDADRYLVSIAKGQDIPPALRFSAQRSLTVGLPSHEAIDLLASQAMDTSLPTEYRQAAVDGIVDLGEIANSILRIFGNRPQVKGGFGFSEQADELNQDGIRLMLAGRIDDASTKFRRAIEQDPNIPNYRFNLGALLLRRGANEGAIEEFSRAIDLDPLYEKAYCERGTAYFRQHQHKLAIDNYSRAIQLDPQEVHNYVMRAHVYRTIGQNDLAIADERHARELNEDYTSPNEVEAGRTRNSAPQPEKPFPTEAVISALMSIGADKQVSTDLAILARNTNLDIDLRLSAVEGLGQLRRVKELAAICCDLSVNDVIRAHAAAEWATVQPDGGGRRTLTDMVLKPDMEMQARYVAAETILAQFSRADLIEVMRRMTDARYVSGELAPGLKIAVGLLRKLKEEFGLDALRELTSDRQLPCAVRELAAEGIAIAGSLDALESLVGDPEVDSETRAQAIRSMRIAKERMQETEKPGDIGVESIAFEKLKTAETAEEVAELSHEHPFVTDFGFILQVRMAVLLEERAERREALTRNLAWLENQPANREDRAFRTFFDANAEKDVGILVETFPILSVSAFQQKMEATVNAFCPESIRGGFSERMRWLKALPPNLSQVAMLALVKCKSRSDVERLAAEYPIIRGSRFRGDFRQAIEAHNSDHVQELVDWLREVGDRGEQLLNQGERAYHDKDYDKSVELLTNALLEDPQLRFAYMMRGLAFAAKREHQKAIDDFTRYIERGAETAGVYEQRGRANMLLKRASNAVSDFNRALSIEPHNEEALLGRALAFGFLNQHQKSRADMQQLVKLGSKDPTIYIHLAELEKIEGNSARALAYLDQAKTLNPKDDTIDAQREAVLRNSSATRDSAEAEIAVRALQAARNELELQNAVSQHTILRKVAFLSELFAWASRLPEKHRPAILQRLEAVHSLLLAMAVEAFEDTTSEKDMKNVINEHELLRDSQFLLLIQRLLDSGQVPADHRQELLVRKQWLETLSK
jgi:WD40 repeat protein/tetratricopeptide (TPR) repeat protein